MPQEQEKKPCSIPGCRGTMTFGSSVMPPGSRTGTGKPDGQIVWAGKPQPGWLCDANTEHFEPLKD
jgi:hypothetical protein